MRFGLIDSVRMSPGLQMRWARTPSQPVKKIVCELTTLPGIGRSTANAIAVFCFHAGLPILDGNVKRVLARCFGIDGFPGAQAVEKKMWQLAEDLLPSGDAATYIQAQMDLGATVCTRGKPRCDICPLAQVCVARREERIAELPAARPARVLPEKQVTMLIRVHAGDVLLEERPPSGIWGGLLSLPELPEGRDSGGHARDYLGCNTGRWRELTQLRHSFTHFRLSITPLMGTASPLPHASESGLRWVALDSLKKAPLPTPVRRILQQALQQIVAAD